MTVNYLVGVELAFLEQHSTEPAPSRNVLVGGIESLLQGMGEERDREMEREREGRKRRRREGGREGQSLFRKWLKDRAMFLI